MATRLDSTYRFTPEEFRRMIRAAIVPAEGADLVEGRVVVDGCPWRFTTEAYYRLLEIGVLTEDSRVELIDGEVTEMAAIGSRHAACVKRLNSFFGKALGDDAVVSVQDPLLVEDGTEPEPDLMVLRPRDDFYAESHPTPADVLLLIEVAETSLGFDRGEKADLYAAAGIVEYWLADVTRHRVFVHTGPMTSGYALVETRGHTDFWSSTSLPQLTIAGKDVFG